MRLSVSSQYLNWEDKAKQYLLWWGKTLLARYSLSEQMRSIFYLYRVFGKCGISGLANFSQAIMTSSVEAWFGWHSGVFTRVSLFLIGWRSEVRDWWWLTYKGKLFFGFVFYDCLLPWLKKNQSVLCGDFNSQHQIHSYLHKAGVYWNILRYNLE